MKYHAAGDAIRNATTTSFKKSFDNSIVIVPILAPSTFRTPISFILVSAIYVASPNKPRQEIKTLRPAKSNDSFPVRCTSRNLLSYDSSAKMYSNGYCGLYFLKIDSALIILDDAVFAVLSLKWITWK